VLLQHQGTTVGYEQLIAEAWEATHVSRHTVDVTIADVRRCLAENGTWLVHRSKAGYTLNVPGSDALVRHGWHFWRLRGRRPRPYG
jgi:DNA-binding winged helix-turn-helix (wHTH) protein